MTFPVIRDRDGQVEPLHYFPWLPLLLSYRCLSHGLIGLFLRCRRLLLPCRCLSHGLIRLSLRCRRLLFSYRGLGYGLIWLFLRCRRLLPCRGLSYGLIWLFFLDDGYEYGILSKHFLFLIYHADKLGSDLVYRRYLRREDCLFTFARSRSEYCIRSYTPPD